MRIRFGAFVLDRSARQLRRNDEPRGLKPKAFELLELLVERTIPLVEGENVIGRDPDVTVQIDAAGVSRRHARILAEHGRFTLEDLGSKNGTYLGEARLERCAELKDGDELRLGQTLVVFRIRNQVAPTATEPSRRT